MAPVIFTASRRAGIDENVTILRNLSKHFCYELVATFGSKMTLRPHFLPHFKSLYMVSLKAHKPEEAAIFFSRVQKQTEL